MTTEHSPAVTTELQLSDAALVRARRHFPVVLFDEAHQQAWTVRSDLAERMNPANPGDSRLGRACARLNADGFTITIHEQGLLDQASLGKAAVLVIAHPSDPRWEHTTGVGSPQYDANEIAAITEFVAAGGGLVVLAEHEQDKYGNNINQLLGNFGITVENTTIVDPTNSFRGVSAWVHPQAGQGTSGILARVNTTVMYRAGAISISADAEKPTEVLISSPSSTPAGRPMLVTTQFGAGRVVVSSDSDLFGDDSIADGDHEQLWSNLLAWAAYGSIGVTSTATTELPPAWRLLKSSVEELRSFQGEKGSIESERERASELIDVMVAALDDLAPLFPHQREYFAASVLDLQRWRSDGFGIPDFLDSLSAFRPDLNRADGVEHIAVFNMYTQNGNPSRNMEAVWVRTVWPTWIDEIEHSGYANKAFVPIEFVDFTPGYDTNSATLFPETVTVRETPAFHWGGIFCDREAARFRMVTRDAAGLLKLQLPPDAELLVQNAEVSKETFVLWDLVHDRTHSHGDLPFDPFMIKQRMPFWMYALEELRCDLNAYVESTNLAAAGVPHARLVRYAIIFDRVFRFSVSGERVRNYDGLGGQILFAHLHKNGILRWTDNTLIIDWVRLDQSIAELWGEVNDLYRNGIDRSRIGYWKSAYDLVSRLVNPNPSSVWNNGIDLGQDSKDLVNAVLPDEFPLNVFFEALRIKLAGTIAATRGVR